MTVNQIRCIACHGTHESKNLGCPEFIERLLQDNQILASVLYGENVISKKTEISRYAAMDLDKKIARAQDKIQNDNLDSKIRTIVKEYNRKLESKVDDIQEQVDKQNAQMSQMEAKIITTVKQDILKLDEKLEKRCNAIETNVAEKIGKENQNC